MQYLFLLFFLILGQSPIIGQHWKELYQAPIHLKYLIPSGWYVGGYMSGKSCHCPGATLNSAKDQSLNMVIFLSNPDEVTLDSLKKQNVWGYNFAPPSADPEQVQTEYLKFEKSQSTWKEDKNAVVLRFITEHKGTSYLIYFWTDSKDVERNKVVIEDILKSIRGA